MSPNDDSSLAPRRRCERFHRQSEFAPGLEAAGERADLTDSSAFQLQRHTGARSFVGSSAVKDDLVPGWNFMGPGTEIVGAQNKRALDFQAQLLDFGRMA